MNPVAREFSVELRSSSTRSIPSRDPFEEGELDLSDPACPWDPRGDLPVEGSSELELYWQINSQANVLDTFST
jgi:hypothetical protein